MTLLPSSASSPDSPARRFSRRLFPLALALLLGLAAFMGGAYWRITSAQKRPARYSTAEAAHAFRLNRQLAAQERQNEDLAQEIQMLTYRIDHTLTQSYRASQRRALDRLADYTGLRTREGLGVEITLRDSNRPYRLEENPNVGIVHNVDMLAIINQLWAAGARAVAINGQRVVAGTEINCAGPVLIVNQSRIAPPFIIQAMGDGKSAQSLLRRINQRADALKQVSSYGVEVEIRVKALRILPYVSGSD